MPGAAPQGRRRPPLSSAIGDLVVVVVALAGMGAVAGVVWRLLVTPAEFTKLANGAAMNETALGQQFGADGWYVVIALVAGALSGALLTWWRSRDPLRTCGALLLGAVVAAAVMAVVGHLLGPGDPRSALQAARVGAHVPERLDVGEGSWSSVSDYLHDTVVIYLCWPIGVLAGALLVLVASSGDSPDPRADASEPAEPTWPESVDSSAWKPGGP
jgi:hypothetical protein